MIYAYPDWAETDKAISCTWLVLCSVFQLQQTVMKARYAWRVADLVYEKEEWKFVLTECGALCVAEGGTAVKLVWFADS